MSKAKIDPKDCVIWWVTGEWQESRVWPKRTPGYIISESSSRSGRVGSGRLWSAKGMPTSITCEWPENALGDKLRGDYGGIVIKRSHVKYIKNMSGIITSMDMIEEKHILVPEPRKLVVEIEEEFLNEFTTICNDNVTPVSTMVRRLIREYIQSKRLSKEEKQHG